MEQEELADLHEEGVAIVDGVPQLEGKHRVSSTATKLRPADMNNKSAMYMYV